jgi:OmcA/MtrC family decaheme c-type cytochrome
MLFALALGMTGAPNKNFSPRDKAFFADAATVAFVRPGLVFTITGAQIASDGTITVAFQITDPQGLPLDRAGVTTPGVVAVSFIAAFLPRNQEQYVAYTTRTSTGAALASTIQAGVDSGGVLTPVGSAYQYVFKTKAPAGFDASATHTIGIYGNRNLTEFNLGTNRASATFNFVPNGAAVTQVRDVIEDASCDRCHDQLSHHGGNRRGMAMCVLCHTPQTTDAESGNTVDMKVMIHKIHMGENLPSVLAGKPYKVSGSDFSTVAFPADPGDPRRCEVCHSQTTGAKQATAYLTNPSRAACGACHDDVDFATGVNHPGGPQFDDNQCSGCHIFQGENDFDASIKGAHIAPTASSLLTGLAVSLANVANGGAGGNPTVTFTVKDGSGNALPLSKLSSISLTMAGPTTQYGYTSFGSDVTTPGFVTESVAGASCTSDGTCTYTFKHPVPANANGTYAIGVEARRTEVVLPGTTSQQSITYGAHNKVTYFSVDGSAVTPRRQVVATDSCNQCHVSLQVHGTLRNDTEYCVMCHNPSNTDASTRANAVVASDRTVPPQGINFNLMIHRIHDGINMQASDRTFVVVGFGGSHNDFSDTLFPALSPAGNPLDLANCSMCHVNGSEQILPFGLGLVTDPQGPVNPNQPIASACTGCHVDLPAASHMLAMTTALGESCNVCHAIGAAFSVAEMHAGF